MRATWAWGRASLRLGASLVLAYRLEVVVQIASAAIVTLLNWSLWTAIYQDRAEVAGHGPAEMTTYVVVAWVVTTFYGNRIDQWVSGRYREGLIAVDLLRPWSLQAHLYLRDLGRALCSLALTTLPLLVASFLLLPLRPPSGSAALLFGVSLLLAHAISFGFSWLVGVAAFRLRNAAGLAHLKSALIAVLSGAMIPLDLYPPLLRRLLLALPFQGMSHTPASLFVETIPPEHRVHALGVQVLWAVGLALAGAWAFRRATDRIVIQGG